MAGPWVGTDGDLYLNDTVVGYVDGWGLSPAKAEIKVTKLGADSEEYLSGLSNATLTASGHITDDSGFLSIVNQFMQVDNDSGGSSVSSISSATFVFKLYVNKAASGSVSEYIVASAVSTGLELSASPEDTAKWSYNARITGTPVYTRETE